MRKSILTIEDSKALNNVFNTIFKKEFEVSSVSNHVQAYHHLQTNLFSDLIIINIADYDSDNFQFLKHSSTSSLFCNIPKVVISKSTDINLKKEILNLGASYFQSMPFDPIKLSHKVKEIMFEKDKIFQN
jgi:two-component system, chemotaxis family, chemotaxis protein CheY